MPRYSLTHLSNEALRSALTTAAAREHDATAELIAHIAEFDARKLFLPAAYGSMLTYCMGELGLSEDAAKKRIRVGRAARTCPAILDALAEGRVHLSGLVLLATHLTPETAEELLAAAAHKSRDDIERFLAARFPKGVVMASVEPVAQSLAVAERSPGTVEAPEVVANTVSEGAPGPPHPRVAPLSAEAFAVQFTRSRDSSFYYYYSLCCVVRLGPFRGTSRPRGRSLWASCPPVARRSARSAIVATQASRRPMVSTPP